MFTPYHLFVIFTKVNDFIETHFFVFYFCIDRLSQIIIGGGGQQQNEYDVLPYNTYPGIPCPSPPL